MNVCDTIKVGKAIVIVLPLWGLLLAGCGGNSADALSEPKTVKEAASQLEREFKSAPAPIRERASRATEAMKSREYQTAAERLEELQRQEDLSFEQRMRIRSSRRELNAEIAEALESEDPTTRQRAKRALKRLDRRPND